MIRIPSLPGSRQEELSQLQGTTLSDWVEPSNTWAMFRACASLYGDMPALTHLEQGLLNEPGSTLSYRELFAEVTRAANVFASLGAQRDQSVGLLLPNLAETPALLWGAAAVSRAMPLNFLLSPAAIAGLMRAAGATVLVAPGPDQSPELWAKALALQAELGSALKALVQLGSAPAAPTAVHYATVREQALADDLAPGLAEPGLDDVAALFHTGGTTGMPRLVQHSHRNQLAAAFAMAYRFQIASQDVVCCGLPLFHVAGAICCALGQFLGGAHLVNLTAAGFRNPNVVTNFWSLVHKHRITAVGAVPTALAALAAVPAEGLDLSCITKAYAGGSLLPRSVGKRFESVIGQPIREIYGMTETSAMISTEVMYEQRVLGSAGIPAPFTEVRALALRADGSLGDPVSVGTPGVLVVRGPTVTPGYLDPRHNSEAFTADGWLITGDIVRVGEDGRITVTGRSKDIIIRSGHNIDPQMIEDAALAYPGVAAAAAVGQPDAYAGELPVCFVVAQPGATVDPAALQGHLQDTVPERPAVPKQVYVIDSLPMTGAGKVFKPLLRCEAAKRLVLALLSDLPVRVEVRQDDGQGLVASIRVADSSDATERVIRDRLQPLLLRWELALAPVTQ